MNFNSSTCIVSYIHIVCIISPLEINEYISPSVPVGLNIFKYHSKQLTTNGG